MVKKPPNIPDPGIPLAEHQTRIITVDDEVRARTLRNGMTIPTGKRAYTLAACDTCSWWGTRWKIKADGSNLEAAVYAAWQETQAHNEPFGSPEVIAPEKWRAVIFRGPMTAVSSTWYQLKTAPKLPKKRRS